MHITKNANHLNPVDFVKKRKNFSDIQKAIKQQKDIEYFALSSLQEEITVEYVKQWIERNYTTSDKFLNWVKTIFKTDNYLSFFKYLSFPVASSKIINDDVEPQLRRVFHADDSFFKHTVRGKDEVCHELNSESFDKQLYKAILFDHNSIVVEDISIENNRYREIISIKNIVSVDSDCDKIEKIAYRSCLEKEDGTEIHGYTYLDSERYMFMDSDYGILVDSPHDLKECPADWISSENMFNDNHVVKKSIFSYILPDLKEFVFLKTLQRMTEPNGAIPVVVKAKTKDINPIGEIKRGISDKDPTLLMSAATLSAKSPYTINPISSSSSPLQAGTVVSVELNPDSDGKVDMDVVKEYLQFHYLPVSSLEYLNDRIKEIEDKIKSSLIGDFKEQNDVAKNELQVKKGKDNKADNLRWLSDELSRIKKLSDYKTLALLHGPENVNVEVYFGSDFFIDSIDELFQSFKEAPNQIERRKILKRISQTKNKNNLQQAERDKILYSLIPYPSDYDFTTALQRPNAVSQLTFELQTRFEYWISVFEAENGQIEEFYMGLGDLKESDKIIIIMNLIKNIIQNEQQVSNNA